MSAAQADDTKQTIKTAKAIARFLCGCAEAQQQAVNQRKAGRTRQRVASGHTGAVASANERRLSAGERHSGGDSVRVPPLPIPNREVKPHRADGTAKVGE